MPDAAVVPLKIAVRGKRVDLAYWNAVLVSMRKHPGNYSRAAEHIGGADRRVIRRLWLEGAPGTVWGKMPMKDVVAAEQVQAAATREQDARAAEQRAAATPTALQTIDARRDAVATRAEEARIIRAVRADVQALLGIVANCMPGGLTLAKRLNETLKSEKVSAREGMLYLTRIATLTQKAVGAATTLIDLEREVLGDPNRRAAGEAAAEADSMTADEAIEALEAAQVVRDRIAESGLALLQGGKASPPVATPQAEQAASPEAAPAVQPTQEIAP